MLDKVCIFTKAGLVLWSRDGSRPLPAGTVSGVVSDVLLEGSLLSTSGVSLGEHAVKCVLDNEHELVFMVRPHPARLLSPTDTHARVCLQAIYKKVLGLTYVD